MGLNFLLLIDLARHSRYLIKFDFASEPLAQAVEHLPFKQRVAGSNPARLTKNPPQIYVVAVSPQIAVLTAVSQTEIRGFQSA